MTIARKPEDTDHLRTSLPQAEADRWRPHLEDITMALGHVSYESGSKPAYVYFPTTAAILKSDLSDLRKVKIESFQTFQGLNAWLLRPRRGGLAGLAGLQAWLERQRPLCSPRR